MRYGTRREGKKHNETGRKSNIDRFTYVDVYNDYYRNCDACHDGMTSKRKAGENLPFFYPLRYNCFKASCKTC